VRECVCVCVCVRQVVLRDICGPLAHRRQLKVSPPNMAAQAPTRDGALGAVGAVGAVGHLDSIRATLGFKLIPNGRVFLFICI